MVFAVRSKCRLWKNYLLSVYLGSELIPIDTGNYDWQKLCVIQMILSSETSLATYLADVYTPATGTRSVPYNTLAEEKRLPLLGVQSP